MMPRPRWFVLGFVCTAALAAAQPATDLDALMARALQRREVNRAVLGDYILDETETFELLGPGRTPLKRSEREFTWFVRDGIHVRSPLRADGVPVAESERRTYEDHWFHEEQTRRARRAEKAQAREAEGKPAATLAAINEPRFLSESYFLDFHFEPGNYFLAGREALDGHDVYRVEYYPTRMFSDDEDEPKKDESDREQKMESEIERKMNKTALVTLWVDPAEQQIVKFTFDNMWMDFLPGGWAVRVDDISASMEMGQPFPNVWLPRNLSAHGAVTLANGTYAITYGRRFSNYRLADVKTRILKKDPR